MSATQLQAILGAGSVACIVASYLLIGGLPSWVRRLRIERRRKSRGGFLL